MLTQTTGTYYTSLLDAAVLQADNTDAPALIYVATDADSITISRAHFQNMVRRFATFFQNAGVTSGDLVIIAHTQSLDSIYAFWGVLALGAIPSMFPTLTEKLDPEIYQRNMAELVRLSDVKAILTTPDFAPQLAQVVSCPVLDGSTLPHFVTMTFAKPKPDSIAFLQHSSGTTGLQKGVALTHDAVLNQLAAYSDALDLTTDDVVVSWLPLYHDMGLIAGFLLPLVQGIPLVLMSPFDWVVHPALLLRAIRDYKGTLCWLPNFAYNHMAQRVRDRDLHDDLSLHTMRGFINCSEPVRYDSHQKFLDKFAAYGVTENMLTVSYAMAENTFAVTQTHFGQSSTLDSVDRHQLEADKIASPVATDDAAATTLVSCGAPIAGTQVRVVDDFGMQLPERHVGEVIIKSDYMLTEYYKRPDLNPFKNGWYFTGDMGYLADGEVYIIGRKKDIIINAGKNIYPQDIEAIVNTIEGIKAGRAVVFGVPDEREGTELIAVVAEVLTTDTTEQHAINRAIRKTVSQQAAVTVNFVKLVDNQWLIKTSSGKIARTANRAKWLAENA